MVNTEANEGSWHINCFIHFALTPPSMPVLPSASGWLYNTNSGVGTRSTQPSAVA